MSNSNRLGKNIRAFRIAFGETQEQLAEIIHVGNTTITNSNQDIEFLTMKLLKRLCDDAPY